MYRKIIFIMALSVFIFSETQAQSLSATGANKTDVPTIKITNWNIKNRILNLNYEISNNSKQDVWICDRIHESYNFEVYLEKERQVLTIRKRLGVLSYSKWRAQPYGKYMRLYPREKRIESLLLALPVNSVHVYKSIDNKNLNRAVNSKHLAIEIGYYVGDLPEIFLNMLKETERTDLDRMITFNMWFGGVLGFNRRNEKLRQRNEEILIPYTKQIFKGEQVLRSIINDLNIPYKETIKIPRYNPPDLTRCTRVKIQYEPSMLEYFYPCQSQQDLLSKKEMEYLRLEKNVVIEDSEMINGFANEIKQEKHGTGGIVSEKSKADVFCYRGSRHLTSLIVYNNSSIETKQKQRIKYHSDLQSLKMYTPQIQPFELRMRCAANLKNLWYRLRFYDRAEKSRVQSYSNFKLDVSNKLNNSNTNDDPDISDMDQIMEELSREAQIFFEAEKKRLKFLISSINLIYPRPKQWCDTLEWSFAGTRIRSKRHEVDLKMKIHVCPSAGEGKSHYAMNPNCKVNSPADTVLLFETKAGWNQHGGPELFSFDNHDPKGGCVLLNDGTVKFIRTKEELRQLRWK